MTNIVYADPFGNYVKGSEIAEESAIKMGTAQRQFRDSDLNNEFMKWYMPHKQEQAQIEISKQKLEADVQRGQMLANLAASGDPHAQLLLQQHLQQMTGQTFDWGGKTPQETAWIGLQMMNAIPGAAAFVNPHVFSAGAHGVNAYLPSEPSMLDLQRGENPQQYDARISTYPQWIQDKIRGVPAAPTTGPNAAINPLHAANSWLEDEQPVNETKPTPTAAPPVLGQNDYSGKQYGMGLVGYGAGNSPPISTGAKVTPIPEQKPAKVVPLVNSPTVTPSIFAGPNGERVSR